VDEAATESAVASYDKPIVQHLLWALKPLLGFGRAMPLPVVITFLMIALEEGNGVSTYARYLGVNRSLMSRYVHALFDRRRGGRPGFNLVRMEKPDRNRRQCIYLTSKGRALAAEVFRNLSRKS
jgi:DNA-binding MarR family transcriptional regulator